MTTKHAEGNTFFAALFLSQWVSPTFKIDLSDDPDAVAVMSLNSVISMVPAVLKIDKFINMCALIHSWIMNLLIPAYGAV